MRFYTKSSSLLLLNFSLLRLLAPSLLCVIFILLPLNFSLLRLILPPSLLCCVLRRAPLAPPAVPANVAPVARYGHPGALVVGEHVLEIIHVLEGQRVDFTQSVKVTGLKLLDFTVYYKCPRTACIIIRRARQLVYPTFCPALEWYDALLTSDTAAVTIRTTSSHGNDRVYFLHLAFRGSRRGCIRRRVLCCCSSKKRNE